MSTEAARRTAGLLHDGRVRGTSLAPGVAGRVSPDAPDVVKINRTSELGNVFLTDQLGEALVHEGRHVDQLKGKAAGKEAADYIKANKKKLEDDAIDYESKNYKKP